MIETLGYMALGALIVVAAFAVYVLWIGYNYDGIHRRDR